MDLAQWLEVNMWGDAAKCEVYVNGKYILFLILSELKRSSLFIWRFELIAMLIIASI